MIDGIYNINQSPFFKESHHGRYVRGKPQEKVSFYLPKTAYNDLMTYFKGNGMNLTDGFNQMAADNLELINTFKRTCFNDVELIMLLPKTDDLNELNQQARLIALYNTKIDFHELYDYQDGFSKEFNIRYDMKDFCEEYFPREALSSMKSSCLFGVSLPDMTNWKILSERLDELYENDLDNSYIVRMPLNNYMDVNRNGQYQHPKDMGKHLGIYVFDEFGHRRFYCLMEWEYYRGGLLWINCLFIHLRDFMEILRASPYKNIKDAYLDFKNSNHDKERIMALIKENEAHGEFLKKLYDEI